MHLHLVGMYKYIGNNNTSIGNTLNGKQQTSFASVLEDEQSAKVRKFKERCAPLEQLGRHEDGGILEGWKLQGVLMVIRHGDRGPMSHVRGVNSINCGVFVGDTFVNR